jgi:hypothetical protein
MRRYELACKRFLLTRSFCVCTIGSPVSIAFFEIAVKVCRQDGRSWHGKSPYFLGGPFVISGVLDAGRREHVTTDGGAVGVYRNYIISSPMGETPSPQAYLVEQQPGAVLRTHFHFNSQFQIFVSGTGTIGRHEAKPYMVQFAARQTGYGPIKAGEHGLQYLTLRPTTIKQRAQYLPESREQLDMAVPKRQAVSEPMEVLPVAEDHTVRTMIEPTPDGLGAWFVHVPSNSQAPAPVAAKGSGRFYVIVDGELRVEQTPLRPLSVLWTGPGEPEPELQSGQSGLDIIIVQFPENAW